MFQVVRSGEVLLRLASFLLPSRLRSKKDRKPSEGSSLQHRVRGHRSEVTSSAPE